MPKKEATDLQFFLDRIAAYERDFKRWEARVEKILKRYHDYGRQKREGYIEAHFNILWSNVQTLSAATFSRLPKPDVSRRFKDNDPIGRVASLILERALDYEVQKYSDYQTAIRSCVMDRFLGGRGTAWIRYEPHFRAAKQNLPTDGVEVTEDIDEPQEELDYECAPIDYVHWRDFGHTPARTWEEVPTVWRKVYLTREQCVERFGKKLGTRIPLDSRPNDDRQKNVEDPTKDRALVYEIWHKPTKTALWISKSMGEILDERNDPLDLDEFFPTPKPLYATLTTDSLLPTPDFVLYQDQAEELDIIADRINGLVMGMKIVGVYDPAVADLSRVFSEGVNNSLVPSTNWAKFSEKGGLKGSIDIVDITPLANSLVAQYQAFEQIKSQIYEITGISDIIRGQSVASETATAQQIKGQYASLRLKAYQDEVARFATDILRMKAQVICGKFDPKTILSISAANQLAPYDQQVIQPAMALLIGQDRMLNPDSDEGPNPLRQFRVEIAADTLVYLDEQEEKQSRIDFIEAVGGFVEKFAQISQFPATAPMVPMLMEMLKFGAQAFKVGKSIEGKIDETADRVVQAMQQQQQQPNPKMIEAQTKAQLTQVQAQQDQQKMMAEGQLAQIHQQTEGIKANAEGVKAQAEVIKSHNELQQAHLSSMIPQFTQLQQ